MFVGVKLVTFHAGKLKKDTMDKQSIGWVGLGNMGTPMCENLLKAGNKLTVYNRTREKEKPAVDAGALPAENLRNLAGSCTVIFTMLANDHAVKEVYLDEQGILSGAGEGTLCIDMSTVSPDTSRLLADACGRKNVRFLDAPVSGSVKPAQDATLIIMVGGSRQDYEEARPLFQHLGKLSLYLGPSGSGSAAKLAINYLLGLNLQGLAETILFARNNGIDEHQMFTIINEGACGNGVTRMKAESVLRGAYPAAFALKHLVKDLQLAKEQDLDTPLFSPLYNSFQDALKQGLGDEDVMAIMKYLEQYPKNESKVFSIL
jgi:3-hydroxyisobutyrate dehydrogenase